MVSFSAVSLLCYRVYCLRLEHVRLFYDEAYYYHWSQQLAWGYYSKPPMVAWLIRISTTLPNFGLRPWPNSN